MKHERNCLPEASSEPIKVHAAAQEYWYVSRQKCPCGGGLSVDRQSLRLTDQGPVDELTASCVDCGTAHIFRFDTSSFFPDYSQPWRNELDKMIATASDVELRIRLARAYENPLADAHETILEATAQGDTLALAWLADAILDGDKAPPLPEDSEI